MFTRPLNALLCVVLDTPIEVQTAYRLSKRIAKHTWVLQRAADVMPLHSEQCACARDVCKRGSPHAACGCNSPQARKCVTTSMCASIH